MAIPTSKLHIRRLIDQIISNLVGLQRDMHANAKAWLAAAQAQEGDVASLSGYMTSAAQAYLDRLSWVSRLQADTENWDKVVAMFAALGGSAADFDAITVPLSGMAQQIAASDKSSTAAIITTCNAVLDAISAPLSVWPE